MIDRRMVFEIHRLKDMGFSIRQVAATLSLDRGTVSKYLKHPDIKSSSGQVRPSKLDPFRTMIKEAVDQYPQVKAPVILRMIKDKGFEGKITIVRDYLRHLRGRQKQAFIRFGLTAIPAAFLGAFLLIYLTDSQKSFSFSLLNQTMTVVPVNAIIGILMIVFAILDLSKGIKDMTLNKNKLWIGGLLSGFFGGLSGHQGALRSAFLINFGLPKESFVATGIAIALTVDMVRMSTYASKYIQTGLSEYLSILLVALIAAFSGAIGGRILLKKITIQFIRQLVAVLLILIGLGLITGLI